jgi:hypothetical protein
VEVSALASRLRERERKSNGELVVTAPTGAQPARRNAELTRPIAPPPGFDVDFERIPK